MKISNIKSLLGILAAISATPAIAATTVFDNNHSDLNAGLSIDLTQDIALDKTNIKALIANSAEDVKQTTDNAAMLIDYAAEKDLLLPSTEESYFKKITDMDISIWADVDVDNFSVNNTDATTPPAPVAVWLLGSGLLAVAGWTHRHNKK
ncbi:MAG: hypothetical protein GXP22_10640 [Gammaproteobacteria bacterium]|nr:hypothetical protein [Gammaproteobacteria bacterium]